MPIISFPWQKAEEKDVAALVTEVVAWQGKLWKIVKIGSYVNGNIARQVPNDPAPVETQPSGGAATKQLLQGYADFRRCFPQFVCFPQIIPTDEVVCLKLYHREDEPLMRLFLDEEQGRRLDRLWEEHRFITQWPRRGVREGRCRRCPEAAGSAARFRRTGVSPSPARGRKGRIGAPL